MESIKERLDTHERDSKKTQNELTELKKSLDDANAKHRDATDATLVYKRRAQESAALNTSLGFHRIEVVNLGKIISKLVMDIIQWARALPHNGDLHVHKINLSADWLLGPMIKRGEPPSTDESREDQREAANEEENIMNARALTRIHLLRVALGQKPSWTYQDLKKQLQVAGWLCRPMLDSLQCPLPIDLCGQSVPEAATSPEIEKLLFPNARAPGVEKRLYKTRSTTPRLTPNS